ncbi:MAG: GNAT family N-acetyltransferase [Lachnospiraceae bacterium]|nr:GNAT family N-acetyltransferase [Lachnospiraceae bacterium]
MSGIKSGLCSIANDVQSGRVFLCYDSEQNAVGTVTLKDNEICRLFVLPEYQKRGFVRRK